MRCKYFLMVLLIAISTVGYAQNIIMKFNDPHIRYTGRVVMHDEASELSWPSTSIKINFKGTSARITLQDEHGDNYYNVIVDDKLVQVLHPDSVKKEYLLAGGLTDDNHTVELFKRTEWMKGKTLFYQFALNREARVLPGPAAKKRKIEFFGNSITCGVAIEDSSGKDRADSKYANSYLSYAALTARHYDAELYNTSQGGTGLMVSTFIAIMPEMYNRLDPTDAESVWDFKKFTPDVVVINLFQNDSWLIKSPDHPQFKYRFGIKPPTDDQIIKAYRIFVKTIRNTYPKAQIICALGNMDAVKPGSPWPGYIEKAVAQIGDKMIFTHFFAYKNTPGHPNIKEQQAMADDLIAFIDQNVKW